MDSLSPLLKQQQQQQQEEEGFDERAPINWLFLG